MKDQPTQAEVNVYLDALRRSGVTNMFGAAPYVRRMFGVNIDTATTLLAAWMESFSERHPPEASK